MLHCPMCTGFWVGLIIASLSPYAVAVPITIPIYILTIKFSIVVIPVKLYLYDAFIASGACYLFRAIFAYACEDCSINLPEYKEYIDG